MLATFFSRQTLMRIQLKVLLHLLPFCCNLNGWVLRSTILGARALGFVTIKSPPTTSQYKMLLYLTRLGWNSNVKLSPFQFDSPFWGLGWTYGSKMLPIEMSSPHSYSTSIHTIGPSCTIWLQYTTWETDRPSQSDRNRPPMHAAYKMVTSLFEFYKRTKGPFDTI